MNSIKKIKKIKEYQEYQYIYELWEDRPRLSPMADVRHTRSVKAVCAWQVFVASIRSKTERSFPEHSRNPALW